MKKNRILITDDNESIHQDYRKVLSPQESKSANVLSSLKDDLFGTAKTTTKKPSEPIYLIDDAYQGEEALNMVAQAHEEGKPYALIFMDVRMPPGMDGIQTIQQIWKRFPNTEIVICTAYSDYSWDEVIYQVGSTDKLMFLKKPFDSISVKQMSLSLTKKWELNQDSQHFQEAKKEVELRSIQLNKMVGELEKMKEVAATDIRKRGEFLNAVGREIKAPLNGIMGITSLLLDTQLDYEQRDYTETLKSSTDSLLIVINDILDFSKIEAGKLVLENLRFDPRKIIEKVVELTSINAQDKNLELLSFLDANLPSVIKGDPGRLRQVLLNLCSNAVKFTTKGEISVTAEKIEELDGDSETILLRFIVKDTGIGIGRDKLNSLFQTFQQIDPSVRGKFVGTGLGLSLSKKLVEMMGGEIEVESDLGVGSTFCFTARFEMDVASLQLQSSGPISQDVSQAKVLLIGNDPTSRRVLSLYLKHWGCQNVVVNDEAEALWYLKSFDAHVLLMDFRDISQATHILRFLQEHGHSSIPAILCTHPGNPGDAKKVKDAGYLGYLTKPLKESHLKYCVGILSANHLYQSGEQSKLQPLVTKHLIDDNLSHEIRILIVDDNQGSRKLLVQIFRKLNVLCDVSSNGADALKAIEAVEYHLVLMDCQMPEMDGYTVTSLLRQREKEKGISPIYVVGLISEDSEEELNQALAVGMNDFITKPFKRNSLSDVMKKVIFRALE